MKEVRIRGFNKPNKSMKLIVDNSITPKEMAYMKYRKLYEDAMIHKAERKEKKQDYLFELKQIIKHAL